MTVVTTMRANDLIGTFGVDTHISYTDGGYANLANVIADLQYLGITQIRDGITSGQNGSAPFSSYVKLAQYGFTFTVTTPSGTQTTAGLQAYIALAAQLNTTVPGSVIAVEGPNEINNAALTFNGTGGLAGAVALQQTLYATVHATTALAGASVDYFTGYDVVANGNAVNPAVTAGLADDDNQHPYPHAGLPPAAAVDPATVLTNESAARGPFVYTETGYSSFGSGYDVVNEDVQARYELDLLLDAARDGASKTYLYQLMDAYAPGSPQGDDGFGLFGPGNTAKPVATAIHNLTTILQDKGATAGTFTPGVLNATFANLPASASSMVVARSDGTFDLVIWNEPTIWTAATKTETAAAGTAITVNLGATYASVAIFDPLSGSTPVTSLTTTASLQLTLTDHPLILQVGPRVATGSAGSSAGSSDVVSKTPSFGSSDPTWSIAASADLTGDGLTDYVWRNAAGQTQIWNASVNGSYAKSDFGIVSTSWQITGTSGTTGDGRTDLIWQNTSGQQLAWSWNGSSYSIKDVATVTPTVASTPAVASGTTSSGTTTVTGTTAVTSTTTVTGATTSPSTTTSGATPPIFTSSDATWKIAAASDLTGDGVTDYVWRNASGQTQIWDGTVGGGYVKSDFGLVDNSWQITGTSTTTGDGKTDLVWQNTSGQQLAWYWTGSTYSTRDLATVATTPVTGSGTTGSSTTGTGGTATGSGTTTVPDTGSSGPTVPVANKSDTAPPTFGASDTTWKIEASADLTGDGLTDYVWRNAAGQTQIWDGTVGGGYAKNDFGLVDNSWQIKGTSATTGDGKTDLVWQNSGGQQLGWYWTGGQFSIHDLGLVSTHPIVVV